MSDLIAMTNEPLDWTTIILGVNSVLLGVVLALGGYIWRRAINDLDEFRETNREEHKEFIEEIKAVKEDIAYMKGQNDAKNGGARK